MKTILDVLIGAVIAITSGFITGLCFTGIEVLIGNPISGPTAAVATATAFTWIIMITEKEGDKD